MPGVPDVSTGWVKDPIGGFVPPDAVGRHVHDSTGLDTGIIVVSNFSSSVYGSPVATADTLANGSNATLARSNHVHRVPGIKAPATTFPGTPVEGDLFYETDTDILWAYDGADWVQLAATGQWANYVPTYTGFTVGNAVVGARWTRMGRTIHGIIEITMGTTSSVTADMSVSIPVAASTVHTFVGPCTYMTGASNNVRRLGTIRRNGTTQGQLNHADPAGNIGVVNPTNPATWATGNVFWIAFTYEAAASV